MNIKTRMASMHSGDITMLSQCARHGDERRGVLGVLEAQCTYIILTG